MNIYNEWLELYESGEIIETFEEFYSSYIDYCELMIEDR